MALFQNQPVIAAAFGGLSVVVFLTYFVSRPTQALEENLQFITWLGFIYNTYWTHLVSDTNPETFKDDLDTATATAITRLKELIDRHAAAVVKRPGLRDAP
jgi:hypothetical protein